MIYRNSMRLGAVCAAFALAACGGPVGERVDTEPGAEAAPAEPSAQLAELRATLAALERRKTRIEDVNAIKRLQRAYGYYVDHALWDEVADLFAEDGTIEIGLDGVFAGRERVREYLHALGGGSSGLAPGQLNEHMQLMPVVTLGADGTTAQGRWRAVVMAGRHGENALWGEGPYENEYVKEDGVWKISRLHWFQTFMAPYEGGWAEHEDPTGARHVPESLTPDAPPSVPYEPWPGTFLPPYHFDNPVTGQ